MNPSLPYKPWTEWRISGIFAAERANLLLEAAAYLMTAADLDNIVYLQSRSAHRPPLFWNSFLLEEMSTHRTNKFLKAAEAVTPHTLLICDDVQTIRNYPQSMTRNIINHIAPRTRFKLIAGSALIVSSPIDLYAPFAVLDKRVLHANHYWCFTEEHRELSVFGDGRVFPNRDIEYLAAKLRRFIYFDLEPENEAQAALYAAMRAAPHLERVHNVEDLRYEQGVPAG